MKYKSIALRNERGTPFALCNLFPNVFDVTDSIEDSGCGQPLLKKLQGIRSYVKTFILERETREYIRYKLIAQMCDNVYYLIIYKEAE